jgi:hypothetical protein
MTSGQHIDYDALALEALRGVVKACLAQVSRTGLVGEHHFYIAFNTQASGVGMSKRLKEKYPVEMTIVLQHRFWDLAVDDDRFEVKLTFDGIPERLVVPFAAVKVFYDPSVPYVLQFEEVDAAQAGGMRRGVRRGPGASSRPTGIADAGAGDPEIGESTGEAGADKSDRRRPARRSRATEEASGAGPVPQTQTREIAASRPTAAPEARPQPVEAVTTAKSPIAAVGKNGADDGQDNDTKVSDEDGKAPDANGGAKIFDLSKFREKK